MEIGIRLHPRAIFIKKDMLWASYSFGIGLGTTAMFFLLMAYVYVHACMWVCAFINVHTSTHM